MKRSIVFAAVSIALAITASARANELLYSFEAGDTGGPTDGFTGAGITSTSTTVGATNGLTALQLTATGGYVGSHSTVAGPLAILDNPNITGIQADITLPALYTGNYADLGVTIFASDATTGDYGEQFTPSTSLFTNIDFTDGATHTVQLALGPGPDPVNGGTETYAAFLNEGYVPSEFQFTLSSDDSATQPFVFDVDNVQAVGISVPEPASLGCIALGGLLVARRRRS